MTENKDRLTAEEAKGLRTAKELEGHLAWLDTFTPAALGVLAIASGIYTYLGVSSLLEDNGAVSFLQPLRTQSRSLSAYSSFGAICSVCCLQCVRLVASLV